MDFHNLWDLLGKQECKFEKKQDQHRNDSELSQSRQESVTVVPGHPISTGTFGGWEYLKKTGKREETQGHRRILSIPRFRSPCP